MDKIKDEKQKARSWWVTFGHAFNGCAWAFRTQKNFKVHFFLSVLAIFLGFWLKISFERFLFLILAIFWGLTVEMVNTAIEKTIDLLTEKYHLKAKIAKDVSAGMMLLLSLGLFVLGALILLPPLWQRLLG